MGRRRRLPAIPEELLAGAKVLGVVLPAPEADREPGPRLICKGTVLGRAVPWKSPTISKTGGVVPTRGYKSYQAWKATVAQQARLDMGRKRPYGGPVLWRAVFYLRPNGRTPPDASNLGKAFEDALQGVAFVNDTQVDEPYPKRVMSATEVQRVEYEVWAT